MVYLTYAAPYQQHAADLYVSLYRQDRTRAMHSKNYFLTKTMTTDEPEIKPYIMEQRDLLRDTILSNLPAKSFTTFRIPKHSGGTRVIEAPEDAYKYKLREITDLLQDGLKLLPHNSSYAYTRGRSAKDAIIVHQENKSRWFLKVDLSNFFGTTTDTVLLNKLSEVYPLNFLDSATLQTLVNYSLNGDGVLPQGSPLSPLLTNLIMIGFDYELSRSLRWFNRQIYTYTRYADDLLISCKYDFDPLPVIQLIRDTLAKQNLPYKLNEDKTRYQSFSGRNWNLGLMYNKDYQITIGTKKKKEYAFLLDCFIVDFKCGRIWSTSETSELIGKLGYLKGIEPIYYDKMIRRYERKHSCDIPTLFKQALTPAL